MCTDCTITIDMICSQKAPSDNISTTGQAHLDHCRVAFGN